MKKIYKTKEEWKNQLSDIAFNVTRNGSTEMALLLPILNVFVVKKFYLILTINLKVDLAGQVFSNLKIQLK